MSSFPDVLLPEILNYLDLQQLLCSAMPVNSFWRSSAIEHPRYWKFISLIERSTDEGPVHSVDLFFLRLARAGAKPVDVLIFVTDPTPVLETLARELYHIRLLTMRTDVTHSNSLFLSMRDTPAPILEYLGFNLTDETEAHGIGVVPDVLFALDSPALTGISFSNVALPSAGQLPAWLANANIRSFSYYARHQPQHLPNVFSSWLRLETLGLGGWVDLTHPAFLQPGTWAGLEFLGLHDGMLRHLPSVQLAHLPWISMADTPFLSADELVFIATVLMKPGPLDVTLKTYKSHHPPGILPDAAQITVALRYPSDAGQWRGRLIAGELPQDGPGRHPEDFVTALQHAPLISRIVSLCISMESWDTLVGRGYLSQFPAVEDLALTLELWFRTWRETWLAPPRTAKLEVPRLRRIVFKYEQYGVTYSQPVLQLADLAEFITAQLSGARLPLRLSLVGAESQGAPEEFAEVVQI